jgi:hypothetical protein
VKAYNVQNILSSLIQKLALVNFEKFMSLDGNKIKCLNIEKLKNFILSQRVVHV